MTKDIVERLPVRRCAYLKDMKFADFLIHSSKKNAREREAQYNQFKALVKEHVENDGSITRTYRSSTRTDNFALREYGSPLQSMPHAIRGFLCMENMIDVDMKNSHHKILSWLIREKWKLKNKDHILEYALNRDRIISQFMETEQDPSRDKDWYKQAMCSHLNKYNDYPQIKNPFFKKWKKEMQSILDWLIQNDDYNEIYNTIDTDKLNYNAKGSLMARVLQHYENSILNTAIKKAEEIGFETAVKMFDGFMYYDTEPADGLLNDLEIICNETFPNLNMKWDFKEHDTTFILPEDYEIPVAETSLPIGWEDTYKRIKEKFEKNHAFITSTANLLTLQKNGDTTFSTKNTYRETYLSLNFPYLEPLAKGTRQRTCNFMNEWISDPTRREYDIIDCIPKLALCPDYIYNTWLPFRGSELKKDKLNICGRDKLLNHLLVMCNREEPVFKDFCEWIAHLIQYPDKKSITPIFVQKKGGGGKTTIMHILKALLGGKKLLSTAKPEDDVWGKHNSLLVGKYLVVLEEIGKKARMEAEGRIKDLQTGDTIVINPKGISAFQQHNYLKFIQFTNIIDNINMEDGDRRNWLIMISDEFTIKEEDSKDVEQSKIEYFNEIYRLIDDDDTIAALYDYFDSYKNVRHYWTTQSMNCSTYHKAMSYSRKTDIFYSWLWEEAIKRKGIELCRPHDIYKSYRKHLIKSGLQHIPNIIAFGKSLSYWASVLNTADDTYISMPIHSKVCNMRQIDWTGLSELFKKDKEYNFELEDDCDDEEIETEEDE